MKRRDFLKAVGVAVMGGPILTQQMSTTTGETCLQKFDAVHIIARPQHPFNECAFVFRSEPCGYKGPDYGCCKSFAECCKKQNGQRYGGFPPIELFEMTFKNGRKVFYKVDGQVVKAPFPRSPIS